MRKILSGLLVVSLLTIPAQPSFAADDIEGHYFVNEMRYLNSKGIFLGDDQGKFNPDHSITRAEFAAMIVRALELEPVQSAEFSIASEVSKAVFTDVTNPDDWYYTPINIAYNSGIVKGKGDGTFKPTDYITRQEMAVMATRAIHLKGIFTNAANLTFADNQEIGSAYYDSVQRLVDLKIMEGNDDNTFSPLKNSTRAQTAAVIYRMLDKIDSTVNNGYSIVEFNSDGTPNKLKYFTNFETAKNQMNDNQAIMQGNRVVYMKSGMAVSNKVAYIYNDSSLAGPTKTYVSGGTELQYIDAGPDWVKVSISYSEGFVPKDSVNLIPSSVIEDQSSYKRVGDELYHTIYNPITKTSANLLVGKAPSFMVEKAKYYSQDGVQYTDASGKLVGVHEIYYNRLDLRTPTQYTAEDLGDYLQANYPVQSYKAKLTQLLIDEKQLSPQEAEAIAAKSPLAHLGAQFKEMEAQYGVNALYLMAHAIHESAWGTSRIAQLKNNLYGINATDHNTEENADVYASFEDSVRRAAQFVTDGYFNERDWRYHGPFLGNKKDGMNVRYASDPFWGEKIAGHMYRAEKYLQSR